METSNSSNIITWSAWQHISSFAEILISEAKKRWETVTWIFNDVELEVDPSNNITPDDLVAEFHRIWDEKREAYKNSPEWIKAKQEQESRRINEQNIVNQKIEELATLDFWNNEAVLNWLAWFQDASDHIGVSYDKRQVLQVFQENWFSANENTWKYFDWEDADNFARYVIWQALDWIYSLWAIHQILHKFINEWKEKFGNNAQARDSKIDDLKSSL